MNKLFDCEIEYLPNFHLMQIYAGFFELEKMGILNLKLKRTKPRSPSVVTAIINKKYKVIYDTDDGLTWIQGNDIANLEHFQNNFEADFYFKRSYDPRMRQYKPKNCEVYPLGLNYNVHPNTSLLSYTPSLKGKLIYFAKTNKFVKKITNGKFYYAKDFEYYPLRPQQNKILFLTRVWDPEKAPSDAGRELRLRLNKTRTECIEACKKKYGDRFTGGLSMEYYAKEHYPSLAMPSNFTNKSSYLQSVKEHTICISTTGLSNSIGWKFGEYVAASRVIVSEPLHFELPGNFEEGKNYFEFETSEQLLERIDYLLSHPDVITETMKNNYYYYNNFVKPERLVLNSLLTVLNDSETNGFSN
jgi:hypothetical protein